MLTDKWCMDYYQPFCSPVSYYSNIGELTHLGDSPLNLVKQEEKTSNSETVHQSGLNIRSDDIDK